MAATYQVQATGISMGTANEYLFALYNTHATAVVNIYRIWMQNNQTTAITGTQNILQLVRIAIPTTFTANSMLWTPVSMDSTNAAIPAGITVCTKPTVSGGTAVTLRRVIWTNDEPAVQTALPAVWQLPAMWNILWDTTSNDANIEPLVVRGSGTGPVMVGVQNVGLTATAPANAGLLDIFCEFTVV